MKNFLKNILLLFLGLFFSISAYSQNYHFKHFTIKDGLSQSQVFGICQDNLGRVWLGTSGGGITIYNGTQISYLNTDDGLPSYSIFTVFNSGDGIWVGTDKGVCFYNGFEFANLEALSQIKGVVRKITQDKNGAIFIFEENKIWKYQNKKCELLLKDIHYQYQLKQNNILFLSKSSGFIYYDGETYNTNFLNQFDKQLFSAVYQDNTGNIWFGNQGKVFFTDGVKVDSITNITTDIIQSIGEDSQGNIWIGYLLSGIDIVKNNSEIEHLGIENGLPSPQVYNFFKDSYGNLWISFDGRGVSIYKDNKFTQFTFEEYNLGHVVTGVTIDSKQRMWVAVEGDGILLYDKNKIIKYVSSDGIGDTYINKILEDKNGNYWMPNNTGVTKFDGKKFVNYNETNSRLSLDTYLCAFEDNKGNIWFGTYASGVFCFDGTNFKNYSTKDGLSNNRVWDIHQKQSGELFFATNGGLNIYHNKKFRTLTKEDGLIDNAIGIIKEDKEGNLWMGTDIGISRYDGKSFINYSKKDGICSEIIYVLEIINDKQILVGTEIGVDMVTFDDTYHISKINHYNEHNGFTGIECNMNAIDTDEEGNIWVGTMNGLMKVNPNVKRNYEEPTDVYLSDIKLFFEKTDWHNYVDSVTPWNNIPYHLKLSKNKNTISFHFTTNEFFNTKSIKYQFMINGIDKSWLPITSENYISYSNLPFGKYSFMVRAKNINREWSDKPATLYFEIVPPFWKTNWFYALLILTIISLVIVYIKIRESNLKRAKEQLQIKVTERTATINSQKEEISKQHELLQKSFQNLRQLNHITQKIIGNLEIEKIINTVYENVNSLMDAEGFGIGIFNMEKNTIGFSNYIEKGEILPYDEESVNDLDRLASWCFINQKDIIINDYDKDVLNYVKLVSRSDHGEKPESLIYTPLTTNRKIGVITVQSFTKNAYDKYHLDIIKNIAVFTAIAIDNSEAYRNIELQKNAISRQAVELSSFVEELKTTNELIEDKNFELMQLSHVVSNTDNAVMIIDQGGDIEWVNDGFTKFYGFTLAEFTKESKSIFVCNKSDSIRNDIRSAIINKETISYEANLPHKNGEILYVQTTWTPIIDENGELIKMVAIDSDISKLKKAENIIIAQHQEIKDSLNYAKYLQQSIFPKKETIDYLLGEYFVLFKPRDVVSGDFYMVREFNNKIFIAVADSTGHGIPGAMMSILGISKLNEILNRNQEIPMSDILEELRKQIKKSLKQTGALNEAKDGIELSLCLLDTEKMEIEYAGANSPLFIIRPIDANNAELLNVKPDKQPVGIYPVEKPFTNHIISIKDNDVIYLFTDGYIDQAGGARNEKFMTRTFKELLLKIHDKNLHEQKQILLNNLIAWQGANKQVDDVLVFGFRINST